jgi:hypothetical protein
MSVPHTVHDQPESALVHAFERACAVQPAEFGLERSVQARVSAFVFDQGRDRSLHLIGHLAVFLCALDA